MVNSFGTASYREVNPALPSLVTFPFLFGLMFGDFGHGMLLTLIGVLLCVFESQLSRVENDV
jgi:V-type H+-transporting ATPase subunit a